MKSQKIDLNHPFFKVVKDGGMSAPFIGEGRFIPWLVIGVNDYREVDELIKLHHGSESGDTFLNWSLPDTIFSPKELMLSIEFIKPMHFKIGIEFLISKQYPIIDGIIQSRAFYLQTGNANTKLHIMDNEYILVEVPNLDFDKKWNEMLLNTVVDYYKKQGANKKAAKLLAQAHIKSMREVWNTRRPIQL